jgi:sterol desaturase/sphingolipid hydroxylase (fatty acid hydroxylase superfamily)
MASPTPERTAGWRAAFLFAPRWPAAVLAVLVLGGLATGNKLVWGVTVTAAIGITLEKLFPRHRQPALRPGLRTDLFHYLFTHVLQAAAIVVPIVVCAVALRPLAIGPSKVWLAAHPALEWVIGFFLFSLIGYWYHRLSHQVPFLWRFHAVHHSSAQLDWAAAARLHPLEFLFGGFLLVPPFIIFGFDPKVVGVLAGIDTAWSIVIHANVRWRLRWMDRLYVNPDYHHWHHSQRPDAINTNFGLPLWDTVFGTYFMPVDRRPDHYGISEPMPATYWGQMAQPFRARA